LPQRGSLLEGGLVIAIAVLIVGLVFERRRQRGVERLLHQRLDFEILVSELSASISMLGSAERPALVTRWLHRLGTCLEVDRCPCYRPRTPITTWCR
jgi:hypothetical protein